MPSCNLVGGFGLCSYVLWVPIQRPARYAMSILDMAMSCLILIVDDDIHGNCPVGKSLDWVVRVGAMPRRRQDVAWMSKTRALHEDSTMAGKQSHGGVCRWFHEALQRNILQLASSTSEKSASILLLRRPARLRRQKAAVDAPCYFPQIQTRSWGSASVLKRLCL